VRLFAALVPPASVLDDLAEAVGRGRAGAPPSVRWSSRERWHLTLAFYGEVDADRAPELAGHLARAAEGVPAPVLSLAGAGRFGQQVLWAGVRGAPDALAALDRLAAAAVAAGRAVGAAVEDRPYRPHLTLARSRGPADLDPLVAALADWSGPPWTADALRLVASTPGARPAHDVLATVPLAAGTQR